MKKIILFMLFANSLLFADIIDKLYPIKELKQISYHSWNSSNSNQEFKNTLLKDFKIYLPKVLKIAKKPIVIDDKVSYYDSKVLKISVPDYYFVFAYIRYLESQNRTKDILNIYKILLNGVENTKIKCRDYPVAPYLYILNKVVSKSLEITLNKNILKKEEVKSLFNMFKKSVILSKESMYISIENEFKMPSKYYANDKNINRLFEIYKKRKHKFQNLSKEEFINEIHNFKEFVHEECSTQSDAILNILKNNNQEDAELLLNQYDKQISKKLEPKKVSNELIFLVKKDGINEEFREKLYTINAIFVCQVAGSIDFAIIPLHKNYINIIKQNKKISNKLIELSR